MLKVNLFTMLLSLIFTSVSTLLLRNLDFAIISIVILLAFRSVLAENYLANELNILVTKDIALELILTVVFILSGWTLNSWYTVLCYAMAYACYLLIKKNDLIKTINNIKGLIKA